MRKKITRDSSMTGEKIYWFAIIKEDRKIKMTRDKKTKIRELHFSDPNVITEQVNKS